MPATRYERLLFGPPTAEILESGNLAGPISYAMPAVNNGAAMRFTATLDRAITGVRVRWVTVSVPGTVAVRIETIDTATGKPTGTLYDANADISVTPATGTSGVLYTFATPPTTLLTVGVEYAVVLITTVAGTTHTLALSSSSNRMIAMVPLASLTAADATTRSNLTELASQHPMVSFTLDGGTEETFGCQPWSTTTTFNIFGARSAGTLLVVPPGVTLLPYGILYAVTRNGTPAGDLRLRLLTNAGTVVPNGAITVNRNSLVNATLQRGWSPFQGRLRLPPGTYRLVADSAGSADSSNSWSVRGATYMTAALKPSGFSMTTTTDGTTWTNSATDVAGMALMLGDLIAPAHPRTRPLRAPRI